MRRQADCTPPQKGSTAAVYPPLSSMGLLPKGSSDSYYCSLSCRYKEGPTSDFDSGATKLFKAAQITERPQSAKMDAAFRTVFLTFFATV